MFIEKIAFQNFRKFKNRFFDLAKTTLIVGKNGVGKTTIMEGIFLLSSGESFRAGKVEEMLALGRELGRVKGKVYVNGSLDGESLELEAMVNAGEVQGKRTQRKLFSVNDVRRRKKDFVGKFQAVIFRPEDLRLVEGSPSRRRNFLDVALSRVDQEYGVSLQTYEQALKRRNRLLQAVREKEQPRSVLAYWNMLMVKHGQVLQKKRQEFLIFLQSVEFPFVFQMEYLPSLISNERIDEYLAREILAGHTLIGPHKDDFMLKFNIDNLSIHELVDLSAYGSRGQQRLGVLWLKLGEMAFVREKKIEQPVLLLDDIMSELDDQSREMVLSLVGNQQVVITTTDGDLEEDVRERDANMKLLMIEGDEE